MSGKLFIIGTPIGNLEDISMRAINALRECDLILAEDTRVSIKLLNHFEIKKKMLSCHKFNESERLGLLERASADGQSLALISDAGMPLVSDPGHPIVQSAIELGMTIVPIAGPSAFLLALVGSGMALDAFVFEGFLPDKSAELEKKFRRLSREERTVVFYVSPHKLERSLAALSQQLGERKVCLARELTKFYEEFDRGTSASLLAKYSEQEVRGECVLVVEGYKPGPAEDMSDWQEDEEKRQRVLTFVTEMTAAGLKLSKACALAAEEFSLAKADIYKASLANHGQ
ncbi:MAG: 16S rRNA (cytidine(1402)-2'-O)-methyltransferase [Cyanobacteria bacterium SZAS TMP-1]|nr:16S rRNA (cytidine(1402)-2'-O)-methyltransferase [Cyanobacteria bacterium SZAS TMP-1]